MAVLIDTLAYVIRSARRARTTSIVAISTLGVGIGTSTAIFSIVEGVLIRPLPFDEPEQLVSVQVSTRELRGRFVAAQDPPLAAYEAWRDQASLFEVLAGYAPRTQVLVEPEYTRRVSSAALTSNLFSMLGARPLRGVTFQTIHDKRGSAPVALLSESFWKIAMGGDPAVLGRSLQLDGRSYAVIGVMPANFAFPLGMPGSAGEHTDLWTSFGAYLDQSTEPDRLPVPIVGRLRQSTSPRAAEAQLDQISTRVKWAERDEPNNRWRFAQIAPLREVTVASARAPLMLMAVAVGLVFVIAGANVANLFAARTIARRREIAIRTALGASRAQTLALLLAESLLLSLIGGALGIVLAHWGTPIVLQFAGSHLPRIGEIGTNWRVLVFALALSALSGMVSGIVPALRAVRHTSVDVVRSGRGDVGDARQRNLSGALVVSQIALAALLLTGAGLLLRSLAGLTRVDLGFAADSVVIAEVTVSGNGVGAGQGQTSFPEAILERARALPGVSQAALATAAPLVGGRFSVVTVPRTGTQLGRRPAWITAVSSDYFGALKIPLRRGSWRDIADDPNGVLISETAAREFFGIEDPIGRQMSWTVNREHGTVVGVVGDVRSASPAEPPTPHIYTRFPKTGIAYIVVVFRTGTPVTALGTSFRDMVHNLDPSLLVESVRTMKGIVADALARQSFLGGLFGLLAAVALTICTAGIYAVVTHSVAHRVKELSLRMALGAQRSNVFAITVWRGVRLASIGLVLGFCTALASSRLLSGFLYEVDPADPIVLFAVAAILAGVALVASCMPALRAARVDPATALREG